MSEPPPREPDPEHEPDPERQSGTAPDGYFRNGVWVPRDAEPDPRPPGWRARLTSWVGSASKDRQRWLPVGLVLLALVVFLVVIGASTSSSRSLPEAERDFLDVVKDGQAAVQAGNEITLVTARRDRARALCALLPRDRTVEDWVGTIEDVGTVSGGKEGFLRVSISDDVELKTSTRPSADAKRPTLIAPGSKVYEALADLEPDDEVRFSGAFLPRRGACIRETSIRPRNGMLTPGFVFRFSAVEGG